MASKTARRPRSPQLSWLITAPLAVLAVALTIDAATKDALTNHVAVLSAFPITVLYLALFCAAEATILSIEVRRHAIRMSVTEVPLVLALFYLSPLTVVLVRLVAAAIVQIVRGGWSVKLAFNLAMIAGATSLATFIIASFGLTTLSPIAWLVILSAVVFAMAVTVAAVVGVISLVQGRMAREDLYRTALPSIVVGLRQRRCRSRRAHRHQIQPVGDRAARRSRCGDGRDLPRLRPVSRASTRALPRSTMLTRAIAGESQRRHRRRRAVASSARAASRGIRDALDAGAGALPGNAAVGARRRPGPASICRRRRRCCATARSTTGTAVVVSAEARAGRSAILADADTGVQGRDRGAAAIRRRRHRLARSRRPDERRRAVHRSMTCGSWRRSPRTRRSPSRTPASSTGCVSTPNTTR